MDTNDDFRDREQARTRAWLASLLLRQPDTWLGRFAAQLRRLRNLSRGQKRRLRHKAAVTLTGAAMLLALGAGALARPPAVHAANITVTTNTANGFVADTYCSLSEAIANANDNLTGQPYTDCDPGSPGAADTINLSGNTYTLLSDYGPYAYYSDNGLPLVTSEIIIAGNSAIIERDGAAGEFRILALGAFGNLTLNDLTVRNGDTTSSADGGGIFKVNDTHLTIVNSLITGNEAQSGGGIFARGAGALTLDNTEVSYNRSSIGGGGLDGFVAPIIIENGSTVHHNYTDGFGAGVAMFLGSLTVDASHIDENSADSNAGGVRVIRTGVEIRNGSTVSGNSAPYGAGGAFFQFSTVTISDSTVSGNMGETGGGIYNGGSVVEILRSTVSDNEARGYNQSLGLGGGIFNGYAFDGESGTSADGETTIHDSTISNNQANEGGGIYVADGTVTITNSTISGNKALTGFDFAGGRGGGLRTYYGTVSLYNTTVTGNEANSGGGINNRLADVTMGRSILSGNTNSNNGSAPEAFFYGSLTSAGFNVLGEGGTLQTDAWSGITPDVTDITASQDGTLPTTLAAILNTSLQNNGGPTETHALVSGSPAIDLGPGFGCYALPINLLDQRGEPRDIDIPGTGNDANLFLCDSGAYELQAETPEAGVCPVEDERVGNEMSMIVGNGMSDEKKLRLASKTFIPDYQDLTALYGQLAGKGPEYAVKYVRFFYPTAPQPAKIFIQESPAYLPGAIHWYGMELDPARLDTANAPKGNVRARWYLTATGKKFKTPRASIYYPTYDTGDEQYANVLALFDDSNTNHAAHEPGYNPTATQVVAIPETQGPADILVKVAVVDVGSDGRPVLVRIVAGDSFETTISAPTHGPSLNIVELLVEDVPAGIDEITIELSSPAPGGLYPNGGDSAAMVGATVNYACGEEDTP